MDLAVGLAYPLAVKASISGHDDVTAGITAFRPGSYYLLIHVLRPSAGRPGRRGRPAARRPPPRRPAPYLRLPGIPAPPAGNRRAPAGRTGTCSPSCPPGGGKSLCYQLPAKILRGTAVVISPLISLMKDQVDAARENNLRAACLNSSLGQGEAARTYRALRAGELDLLYISPERFAMDSFLESLRDAPIAFFAVDEAHCLSEWGHDFRPDYLSLGGESGIRRNFPGVPIAAFTATATSEVGRDIVAKLGLPNPFQVRASFNRPNLYYEVRPKREVDAQILEFLREHPEEPGIVYRTTRDSVERTAAYLAKKGVKALPYHAGLPQGERQSNQEAFNRDEVQVMVATIAFGMGIDKSNVRFVIHADLPKNLEGYYQETGRAGRDGDPSLCVLYYGGGDVPKLRHFLDQISDERERALAVRKLNRMAEFAGRNQCRRRQLLAYFEETYPEENCASCDICTGKAATLDATREAQMVLSAVARTGERFGASHVVDVLVGADTQKVRDLGHDSIKTYGVGKHKDKPWWRSLIGEMLGRGFLGMDDGPYPVLKLTHACLPLLQGKETLEILELGRKDKAKARTPAWIRRYGRRSGLRRGRRRRREPGTVRPPQGPAQGVRAAAGRAALRGLLRQDPARDVPPPAGHQGRLPGDQRGGRCQARQVRDRIRAGDPGLEGIPLTPPASASSLRSFGNP